MSDIESAKLYYEEKQKGLGHRFTNEVRFAINKLANWPYFQVRYKTIRCAPVSKFPFLIHYSVDEAKKLV